MIIRFPWLISRKKLIFNCILEILLIFLLNKYIFSNFLKFSQDINMFTVSFLPFWLLFSYIFGRYSYEDFVTEENNLILFLKLFLISIVISFLSLGFVFIISYNINLNNYNHFDKIILSYSTFISFFINIIQFLIIYKIIKTTYKEEEWIFIGSEILFPIIRNELKWSRKKIKIIYKRLDSNFSKSELKRITGIFFDKLDNMDNKEFRKLSTIQHSGVRFINLETWSENYLQRFPPEILSPEYMIRGNFRISQSSFHSRIKRIGDLSFSIVLLFFASPLIFISSILIYLEDGKSVFYKQERVGLNQKLFTLYKLRTMKIDAEEGTPKWASKNDLRVTKVGRILRKTRLDELPQLLCVIKGDMSLIGPRPEREVFDKKLENCIPFYKSRYFIKPGLSGWAQVNYPYGASIDDAKRKLSYDIYYLRNFSIFLDFLIFFKTIRIVFLRKGSHPLK